VLQAVHNGNNAHPLFKAVQLGGNAGRGQPLLTQADGLTHNDGLALGGSLRINDIDLGVGLGSCQHGALVGAGKLLRNGNDNDLVTGCGGVLKTAG